MTSPPVSLAPDCRFFLGDRPCRWHKSEGRTCTCERYEPIRERVLMIKLDAMGDVLRTTALLPALAEAHSQAAIDWITRAESVPLLLNNPYLADVIPYGPDALVRVQATAYDRVINLDAGKLSAGLAALARSGRKDGYVLHPRGHVVATNTAAQAWLEMGTHDLLKKQNDRTYQSIMLEILGLPRAGHRYVLQLTEAERAAARARLERLGLRDDRPVVGLNIGAGGRWQLKRWRLEGFADLCERLHVDLGAQPLLLGGPAERELGARLLEVCPVPVFDAGYDNEVRQFAALAGECDVIVTGDTLALHVALALGVRVVALFGPTSHAEIELYGLGEKVYPDMDCLVCYKAACDFVPNCMDRISEDMVAAAVERQVAARAHATTAPV
jgi:heptosyltransferase-2